MRTSASCVIVPERAKLKLGCQSEVKNPKLAFALVAELLHPQKKRSTEIHTSAVIATNAKLGEEIFVGAFVCIGEDSSIGDRTQIRAGVKIGDGVTVGQDCVIHPSVFIEDGVTIGNRAVLHAGVVIGADGFGYVRGELSYHKFPQIGTVIIEDDVELGANTGILPGKIVRPGVWWGIPIQPLDEYKRLNAHISRLPHVRKELKELKARIEELESRLSDENG